MPAADGAGIPSRAPRGRRRRANLADFAGMIFILCTIVGVGAFAGGIVYDQIHKRLVEPQVGPSWARAQEVLVRRLHQQDPLEFGAVWRTHSGLICGLVNGRGSFSGLAGMTPFAVDGQRAVFALDQTALDFAPYWRECMTDQWIKVLDGSMEAGGCATRLGQARCQTVMEGG